MSRWRLYSPYGWEDGAWPCDEREETFVNSRTRHAMDIWAAACVDDTGRITQKGIRLNAYSGAYGSNGHAVAALCGD